MNEQNEAGHTPGPWSVGCPNGKRHYIMKSGYVVVAELPHVQGDSAMVIEAYKEREANAALIAAAPELLAALEYLISPRGQLPGSDALQKARAAIAKAKGAA